MKMKLGAEVVTKVDLPQAFADFFKSKVDDIVKNTVICPEVYNGKRKVNCNDENFMTESNILECVKTIKIKNVEGYDRIPQRVLVDGIEILLRPLAVLFDLIYRQSKVPDQWLVSKIIGFQN